MFKPPSQRDYGDEGRMDPVAIYEVYGEVVVSPECQLLAAMLELTIRDYVKGQGEDRRTAEVWLRSSSEVMWSFRWVCMQLGWRCEEILEALKTLKDGGVWNGKRVAIRG